VLGGALAIVLVAVLLGTATVLLLFPGAHGPYGEPEGGTHASGQEGDLPEDTSAFRGVNWADPRDNYASDELVLSGLTSDMTPQEVTDASTTILTGFEDLLGANTVRIPINPATVTDPWWESYRATIDTARAQGMTVILSYWEADDQKDGFIDDEDAYNAMWDTVIETYAEDEGVYVEPMNEPFGYSPEDWVTTATRFVQTYEEDIPRSRIIVSGSGYNDDVTVVGAAPDLEGTLLSLHFYGFWNDHTSYDAWYEDLQPRIGEYGPRTLISEAGSPMSVGLNYANPEGNVSTSYWGALTDTAREQDMGIVYWPGLRTGDSYSMTRQGDDGSLEVSSETGHRARRARRGTDHPAGRWALPRGQRGGVRSRIRRGPLGVQRRRAPELGPPRRRYRPHLRRHVPRAEGCRWHAPPDDRSLYRGGGPTVGPLRGRFTRHGR
jgi:hypothetical protein